MRPKPLMATRSAMGTSLSRVKSITSKTGFWPSCGYGWAGLGYDAAVAEVTTAIAALRWRDALELLDQRRLPREERWLAVPGTAAAARLIRALAVRGAPAIGLVAAYALAAEVRANPDLARLRRLARRLAAARPTATNLARAVADVMEAIEQAPEAKRFARALAAARRAARRRRGGVPGDRRARRRADLRPPGVGADALQRRRARHRRDRHRARGGARAPRRGPARAPVRRARRGRCCRGRG